MVYSPAGIDAVEACSKQEQQELIVVEPSKLLRLKTDPFLVRGSSSHETAGCTPYVWEICAIC
jgi:hypothetical protein